MTSKAFTSRNYCFLLLALISSAIFRLLQIEKHFAFNFDQEVPAQAAYDFFTKGKISLIGQGLSFEGFFLGPIHNWINFIPYGLCKLKPDCVPYFFTAITIITLLLLFIVVHNIFGKKIAIITFFVFAFSFVQIQTDIGANSNYALLTSEVIVLYSMYKYLTGKDHFLLLCAFVLGLATVNFNPVFIFTAIACLLAVLLRRNFKKSILFLSLLAFTINYLPLVIFNIRHDNILLHNFTVFVASSSESSITFDKIYFLIVNNFLSFYTNFLFQSPQPLLRILTIAILVLGIVKIIKIKSQVYLFLIIWAFVPVFGFIFYKNHIPDYYFLQTILPLSLITAIVLRQRFIYVLVFMGFFLYSNFSHSFKYETVFVYKTKKEIVNYIIDDSGEDSFNLYYELPQGQNTGYQYLFKYQNKQPQEGAKNLYMLTSLDPLGRFDLNKYTQPFKDKNVGVKKIGFAYIVSVK